MYVILRSEDGAYVNQPGSRSSYTFSLERAQKFWTLEAAERNRCSGNEAVANVDDIPGMRVRQ